MESTPPPAAGPILLYQRRKSDQRLQDWQEAAARISASIAASFQPLALTMQRIAAALAPLTPCQARLLGIMRRARIQRGPTIGRKRRRRRARGRRRGPGL